MLLFVCFLRKAANSKLKQSELNCRLRSPLPPQFRTTFRRRRPPLVPSRVCKSATLSYVSRRKCVNTRCPCLFSPRSSASQHNGPVTECSPPMKSSQKSVVADRPPGLNSNEGLLRSLQRRLPSQPKFFLCHLRRSSDGYKRLQSLSWA